MKASTVDDKRRIVMPSECPPGTRVTIEPLDDATWMVRRKGKRVRLKQVLIPVIDTLPPDPEWEKLESKIGHHVARRLPEPKD